MADADAATAAGATTTTATTTNTADPDGAIPWYGILSFATCVVLAIVIATVAIGADMLRRSLYKKEPSTYYSGNRWARRPGDGGRKYRVFFDGRRLGLRFRKSESGRSAIVARVEKNDVFDSDLVREGHFLRSVNGVDVRTMRFKEVLARIRRARRPLSLGFQEDDPMLQNPPLKLPTCPTNHLLRYDVSPVLRKDHKSLAKRAARRTRRQARPHRDHAVYW